MAKKIFMTAYDEKSLPSEEVIAINGVSFKYDKPFFLICNFPIQDKAYFEFSVSDYYPIKAFRNVPLYIGISKEVSFGVLNSDFIIGSLYYNAETTEYDIMSKYSKQYLNYHAQPEHIYSRLPGAQDVIGLGVDYEENCLNVFVNGKLFYKIQNNTYDEDGNVLTSFDLTSGTFYFCIWSNIYYKKILSDFNLNSGDENIEKAKEISGVVNFNKSSYIPDGYISMKELYENYIPPIDPEDEEEPTDAHITDPNQYAGMEYEYMFIGESDIPSSSDPTICTVEVLNDIDTDVNTLGLYCIEEHKKSSPDGRGIVIYDKNKYTMDATLLVDEDNSNTSLGNRYHEFGYNLFVNKPIPVDSKVYFEFYVTEGQVKKGKIGIPVSIGISSSMNGILVKSSRMDLFHEQWSHYYWKEMDNDVAVETKTQQLHEIDNVYITTLPEQGQVIGVGFNLKNNKMTVYANNSKMYTIRTNVSIDRESEEIFNYFEVENTYFLKLVGDKGTIYNQLSTSLPDYFNPGYLVDDYEEFGQFYCENNGITYNVIYLPYHGRLEFYEDDGLFYLTQDEDIPDKYYQDDKVFWYSKDEVTGYIKLASESGLIVYTQIKSDVMIRSFDGSLFEFRVNDEDNSIILIKVGSLKKMTYSYLDYSKSWEHTYAFIHDEGAFDGTIRGSFNFGQSRFAGSLPEGYISLWDYYSITKATYDIKDINCYVNISNDRNIYNNILSCVKIVNSGRYEYNNNGINKMILNHTLISDQETYYHSIDGANLAEFTETIARENNGYVPEEKLNSTSISFEGVLHYTIYIPTVDHQTIEVYLNSRNKYTTTFQAPKGAFITARVIPEYGYTAGRLNLERFTLTEDVMLSVSDATITNYTVNIISSAHQRIEVVKLLGYDEEGRPILDESTVYRSDGVNKFITTINDPVWFVRVISDMGYIAGVPNKEILYVDKDTVVSATDAIIESYKVTIPATPHQIVGVRYNNTTYKSERNKNVILEVPFGGYVYISSINVDLGYKIESEYPEYIQIMKNTTVEVPNVVDDMCTITVDDELFDGTYSISNSTKDGNVYTIRRGDTVTITADPADGLYIDEFILD